MICPLHESDANHFRKERAASSTASQRGGAWCFTIWVPAARTSAGWDRSPAQSAPLPVPCLDGGRRFRTSHPRSGGRSPGNRYRTRHTGRRSIPGIRPHPVPAERSQRAFRYPPPGSPDSGLPPDRPL